MPEISTACAAVLCPSKREQFRILDAHFPQPFGAQGQARLDIARSSLTVADVKDDFLTWVPHWPGPFRTASPCTRSVRLLLRRSAGVEPSCPTQTVQVARARNLNQQIKILVDLAGEVTVVSPACAKDRSAKGDSASVNRRPGFRRDAHRTLPPPESGVPWMSGSPSQEGLASVDQSILGKCRQPPIPWGAGGTADGGSRDLVCSVGSC